MKPNDFCWRVRFTQLLLATALSIAAFPASATYYALLIGPSYPGGPVFDDTIAGDRMKAMAKEMAEWSNWNSTNITTLTGVLGQAAITQQLQIYENLVGPDDFFMLMYHGHGDSDSSRGATGRAALGNGGEKVPPNVNTGDESFVYAAQYAADGSLAGVSALTDDFIGAEIRKFNPAATKLAVAISCFGGGMWGGGDGDMETASNIAFYGAVKEDQKCPEPPVFYANLLKAISKENARTISIDNWYSEAKTAGTTVADHWYLYDNPSISSSWESTMAASEDLLLGFPVFIAVPEPGTLFLLSLGVAGLALSRRRGASWAEWPSG